MRRRRGCGNGEDAPRRGCSGGDPVSTGRIQWREDAAAAGRWHRRENGDTDTDTLDKLWATNQLAEWPERACVHHAYGAQRV
ncbi:hypothetical protein E2562_015347 [Oryza meyeriana var. granulata]|uniref:Uncharacterized protein n=1 Tax=Oryza meyeriana var. granulata TaxID=110450 RepID=A0A6G1EJN5_9ORYZ|nr:hypothetical protein E2562_015347 [Oryza meyeriana var. granulata]